MKEEGEREREREGGRGDMGQLELQTAAEFIYRYLNHISSHKHIRKGKLQATSIWIDLNDEVEFAPFAPLAPT